MLLKDKNKLKPKQRRSLLEIVLRKSIAPTLASALSPTSSLNPHRQSRARQLVELLVRRTPNKAITSAPPSPLHRFEGDDDPFSANILPFTATSSSVPATTNSSARIPLPVLPPIPHLGEDTIELPALQAIAEPRTYIQYLPEHVLEEVAGYLDKEALRAMMRTCGALRQAAEVAMKPLYADLVVTPYPPSESSIFDAVNYNLRKVDAERWDHLQLANRRAETMLDVYPAAGELLRRLQVEVRSDDRYSGWALIERFSSQLEQLTIDAEDDVRQGSSSGCRDTAPDLLLHNWSFDFLFNPLHLTLPNLTTLNIAATAQTLSHLLLYAGAVPNLHTLTLSAFGSHRLHPNNVSAEHPGVAYFPNLYNLTIAGDDAPLFSLLSCIVGTHSDIRHLTLRKSAGTDFDNIRLIGHSIMCCPQLIGLALYGPDSQGILWVMADYVKYGVSVKQTHAHMTDLISQSRLRYPLLVNESSVLNFPSLERLVFITLPPSAPPKAEHPEYSSECDLAKAFAQYPKLSRVQWVSGYPTSPFVDYPPAEWAKRGVRCSVSRPEADQPLQPMYPPFSTRRG